MGPHFFRHQNFFVVLKVGIVVLLGGVARMVVAQDVKQGVTYVCHGEGE